MKAGSKVKYVTRIGMALTKFGTDDVMMMPQTSFEKPTSHKSWTTKLGRKVKGLARIGLALPKFGTDDIMLT